MNRLLIAAALFAGLHAALNADETSQLTTRAYAVADLVVDGPTEESQLRHYFEALRKSNAAVLAAEGGPQLPAPVLKTVHQNLNDLTDIIRQTAADESVRVTPHFSTRSLVVRASRDAHDEIMSLLADLRNIGSATIGFRIDLIQPQQQPTPPDIQQTSLSTNDTEATTDPGQYPGDWSAKHGPLLSPDSADQFRAELAGRGFRVTPLTSGTVRSGCSADCLMADTATIVTATATTDRRHVRAILTRYLGETLYTNTTVQIPSGHTVIQPLVGDDGKRQYCLITATIRIVEEEEEVFVPSKASAD